MMNTLLSNRLLICVGAGGVGKNFDGRNHWTAGSNRWQKVLVLTIDPAKDWPILWDSVPLEMQNPD